jgi:hypothetical protein
MRWTAAVLDQELPPWFALMAENPEEIVAMGLAESKVTTSESQKIDH